MMEVFLKSDQMSGRAYTVGRYLLGAGILWLVLGMVVMPSGVSFNPGRGYQNSLIVLLYLPALLLACLRRGAVWRALWPLPAFRVMLLLMAWAMLSLSWAHLLRSSDEVGRIISPLVFVLAWQAWAGWRPREGLRLLYLAGIAVAACALVYGILFTLHHQPGDRIVGPGVIGTSNYAAAAMGAVGVWMAQLPVQRRALELLRWLAVAALLVFVGLTQSRGIWLALLLCVLLAPLWNPGWKSRVLAISVALLALLAGVFALPLLTERGASFRPQIFAKSVEMIALHPWSGIGQGTPFIIDLGTQQLTHSHNLLTQAAIELGLPGLLLVVAMWLLVAWEGWRGRDEASGRLVLAQWVFSSVVVQFDLPQLLDSPRPGWLLIWLPFALALGLACRRYSALGKAELPVHLA
jgi:O-antigen ligase